MLLTYLGSITKQQHQHHTQLGETSLEKKNSNWVNTEKAPLRLHVFTMKMRVKMHLACLHDQVDARMLILHTPSSYIIQQRDFGRNKIKIVVASDIAKLELFMHITYKLGSAIR